MAHGGGTDGYHDVLVFLAAAGVLVPLLHKLKVSPVLGFLAAGVLLGPDGLGRLGDDTAWIRHLTIQDRSQIQLLSELGVVFLLFMIGLELSWERLRSMRRLVFGLGVAQILVCAVLLGVGFLALGQTVTAAVVLGLALALSSTAVVMPVMAEGGRLTGTTGRTVFSVLLAQDLAVPRSWSWWASWPPARRPPATTAAPCGTACSASARRCWRWGRSCCWAASPCGRCSARWPAPAARRCSSPPACSWSWAPASWPRSAACR